MKTVISMSAAEMNASIKSIRKMAEDLPFAGKLNNVELENGCKRYGHEAFFIEEKVDDEGCILSITSKEEYTADSLLVMEEFIDTFGVEIMATILKMAKVIKSGKGITSKLKAFGDRASSIMKKHDPFQSYAVIEVDWLINLGVKAALVIENRGFNRRVVGIHHSGDTAALAFIETKTAHMDLSTIGPFSFTDVKSAHDAAVKIINTEVMSVNEGKKTIVNYGAIKPDKKDEEDDKYIFNGVRGGMRLDEDIDCIVE